MKTKFILHGGFASHQNEQNDKFFREILLATGNSVNILLVYFSKELDRIPVNRDEDILMFNKNKVNKILSFEVADESIFREQVKRNDIIYFHGGNTLKLLNTLKKFQNLDELFGGKVVAGESAGANVLGKIFYSPIADGTFEGLGILPVKIISHYSEKYKDKIDELNKCDKKSEFLLLPEYQYKVFEI